MIHDSYMSNQKGLILHAFSPKRFSSTQTDSPMCFVESAHVSGSIAFFGIGKDGRSITLYFWDLLTCLLASIYRPATKFSVPHQKWFPGLILAAKSSLPANFNSPHKI